VLIADSVGMGKTWISKKLLEDFAYHRQQTLSDPLLPAFDNRGATSSSLILCVPPDETPSVRRMREICTSGGMREEERPPAFLLYSTANLIDSVSNSRL